MARSATWPADPHDHGKAIIGALTALTVLAVITIALRFYVRIKIGPSLASHDWTMLVAVVCIHVLTYSVLLNAKY
jgi:hypothetical protein